MDDFFHPIRKGNYVKRDMIMKKARYVGIAVWLLLLGVTIALIVVSLSQAREDAMAMNDDILGAAPYYLLYIYVIPCLAAELGLLLKLFRFTDGRSRRRFEYALEGMATVLLLSVPVCYALDWITKECFGAGFFWSCIACLVAVVVETPLAFLRDAQK